MSDEPTDDLTDLTIADTPELLTPAWLTDALERAGVLEGARVTAADQKPLGTGQMCDSVRLTLTYDRATSAPPTMVAKLPAADEASRGAGLSLRAYEKEVRFYQRLAPDLPARTPTVYHADIDTETASFVLLLEDLAPAEQGDQLAGCSPAVAAAAVRALVELHAPRWGDASLLEHDWLHTEHEESRGFMLMFLPVLWAGFQERYADVLHPAVPEVGGQLFAALDRYFAPRPGPTTIVHGDYRLDNLLLSPDGDVRGIVDWQTCAVGPALRDVAYFIGAGLLPEDRRPIEEGLVRDYHAALGAAGVTGFGWDECWREYRWGTFAGLVMAIGASMLVERTDRGDEMFMAMASRHSQHALDLDATSLLTGGA